MTTAYDPAKDAHDSYYAAIEAKQRMLTAACVALAEAGIEPDIQELLVQGNPMRGIRPGALSKAISAAIATVIMLTADKGGA